MSSDQPPLLDYSNLKHPRLDGGGMRDGKFLVVSADVTLLKRCIRCNSPADEPPLHCDVRGERDFEITLTERKVRVQYFLCPRHLRLKEGLTFATIISVTITLLVVFSTIYLKAHIGWNSDFTWIIKTAYVAAGLFLAASILLMLNATRQPRRYKVRKNLIYIAGFSRKFLAEFPVIPKS